jgi:hypothetical protein
VGGEHRSGALLTLVGDRDDSLVGLDQRSQLPHDGAEGDTGAS